MAATADKGSLVPITLNFWSGGDYAPSRTITADFYFGGTRLRKSAVA